MVKKQIIELKRKNLSHIFSNEKKNQIYKSDVEKKIRN